MPTIWRGCRRCASTVFLLRPLLSLFSSLVLCGLLMLFGFSAVGTIEVGVLYAFISYLGRLNEPLIELDHPAVDAAAGCGRRRTRF